MSYKEEQDQPMDHDWNYGSRWSGFYREDHKYHGLHNQGATCYLNSVLQVLFMTEDFREAVKKNACGDHIDIQLASLFKDLKSRTGETVQVTKKLGIFRVNEQRDAAEHFEKILTLTSDEAAKIFKGQLAHSTVCSNCDAQTEEELPFWNLPLALVKSCNKDYSVEDGIEEFFRLSDFTGDNQMYCDECCVKSDATASCVIKDHPEVLMLLLKRFEFSYVQMSYVKNSRVVDIPPTIWIPENQMYELYAYVEHFGSLKGGHYTATIKPQDQSSWYCFNDSSVTLLHRQPFQKATSETSQSAYLLFYRKKQTGSPENGEVSNNGGLPPDTNENYVQCRDVNERDSDEETVEINAERGTKRRSTHSPDSELRVHTKQNRPSNEEGNLSAHAKQQEKDEGGKRRDDEERMRRKAETDDRAEKRTEVTSPKKKKVEGKTDNDDSVARRNHEQLKKHDDAKHAKDNSSVSFGEQKTQKNNSVREEETSNRMSTGHEQQGAQNVDEGAKKPPQMGKTPATRQRSGEGVQVREHVERPEEKTGAAPKTRKNVTGKERAKEQGKKGGDEQNQITVEAQEGSEETRGQTHGAGRDETRGSDQEMSKKGKKKKGPSWWACFSIRKSKKRDETSGSVLEMPKEQKKKKLNLFGKSKKRDKTSGSGQEMSKKEKNKKLNKKKSKKSED
ncbi:uncharacterized protein PAE49_021611 [Odontesthes bonariensis]|uniref:uncharacterized protein LOC142368491 n=1 Tax=Odontesthes bonariensis TaxID=219752 RepID=UPI003F589688